DIELAARHHVEHGLEVALLRPAHEAERIVHPLDLVLGIIAAGSVGTRNLKGKFLFIEIRAVQLQSGNADQNDTTPLAAHPGRVGYRLVRICRSSDEHRIHAVAAAECHAGGNGVLTLGRIAGFSPEGTRQLQLAVVKVDRQPPAAMSAQQLYRQETDQSGAHDHEGFAQGWVGKPYALQPYACHHREGGLIIPDIVGDFRTKVLGYFHDIGVGAIRQYAVAWRQALDAASNS